MTPHPLAKTKRIQSLPPRPIRWGESRGEGQIHPQVTGKPHPRPSTLSTLPSLQPTRTNLQKSCERFPLSSEERAVVLRPREREKVAAGRMRAVGIKTNPVVRRSFPLTSFSFRGTTPVVRPPLKAIPPSSGLIAPRALRWNWPQLPPVRFPLSRFPAFRFPLCPLVSALPTSTAPLTRSKGAQLRHPVTLGTVL